MHELSLMQRLVQVMEEQAAQAGGGQVVSARMLLGELAGAEEETLAFAFEVASRNTCAQGCKLEIVRVPARLKCHTCGTERGGAFLEPCPSCGQMGSQLLQGRELRLETMELDDGRT